jgi:hypothetical protein
MKSLNTQVTGGTTYTTAFSASLGDTAYMPDKEDIDLQELDLFKVYDDSSIEDPFDAVMDGHHHKPSVHVGIGLGRGEYQ